MQQRVYRLILTQQANPAIKFKLKSLIFRDYIGQNEAVLPPVPSGAVLIAFEKEQDCLDVEPY